MKKFAGFLLGLLIVLASLGIAVAQNQQAGLTQPPKVIVIGREYLKPGKAGMSHEKTESAFVQAFARAKWPTHYIAMDSLSGKTRSLFITPYDSFEAWEKDSLAIQKNTALAAALDHASVADGELLASTDQGVFCAQRRLQPAPGGGHAAYALFRDSSFSHSSGARQRVG
ncbi:MAG TPA: hypothetical protein VJX73_09935 [Terracidiphilus sp.]|nr:hypothetical protein [Terracidiphilus sp.]